MERASKILVTGGAGFIGSEVIRQLISETDAVVINVDKLTYAGNLESLVDVSNSPRYIFELADIRDSNKIRDIFGRYQPTSVMHLAAESHVDRSIDGPAEFVMTNVVGTFTLLEAATAHWNKLSPDARESFRFLHVSTDEVYGSLGPAGYFTEETPYSPNSPYSASKAGSDHLVRAWLHTYKLPTIVTNCSNNYGPYQFPEKLIPLCIRNAVAGKPLPVYGKGDNIRDWLFVEDHARALRLVLDKGKPGETYNIGGRSERRNLQVVENLCALLDELSPNSPVVPHSKLITFVKDRPGHDQRYAIDSTKIEYELGWRAREQFETGLIKTVEWYLTHVDWCDRIASGAYQGQRLGLGIAS